MSRSTLQERVDQIDEGLAALRLARMGLKEAHGEGVSNSEENFARLFGHSSINELVGDWKETRLGPADQSWVNFPPKDFLDFARSYPRVYFDQIPPSTNHLKQPSLLISHAHRLWTLCSRVHRELSALKARNFLDLGSFPFFGALVVRDYFGFQGNMTVTTNIDLADEGYAFLSSRDIRVIKLDLDPFVSDPAASDERLPATMNVMDNEFDLILTSNVIEHLYHPLKILQECHRLLRNGGRIIVSTDNAMMIDVFVNYAFGYGHIFEPVQHTAAMTFSFWRGHVRFFTSKDLRTLLGKAGLHTRTVHYSHCFLEVLFEEYFKTAAPSLPAWKKRMVAEVPWLRNEVVVVAEKGLERD